MTVTDRVSADELAVHTTGARAFTINRFAAAAQLQTIGTYMAEGDPSSLAPGHAELTIIKNKFVATWMRKEFLKGRGSTASTMSCGNEGFVLTGWALAR